jgi:hypothetical protein
VSVNVRPATPADEADFAMSSDGQLVPHRLPRPAGKNYLARILSAMHARVQTAALVDLAHVVPCNYVHRYERALLDCIQVAAIIKLLRVDSALELVRLAGVKVSRLMRANGLIDDAGNITEGSRNALNNMGLPSRSLSPFGGATVDDLIQWFIQHPATVDSRGVGPLALVVDMFKDAITWGPSGSVEEAESAPIPSLEQAGKYIISTFSSAIRYLGPLRADPYATQSYSPSGQPDDVGSRGEYAAAVYAANHKQPIRWWNPVSQQTETTTLEVATDAWLKHLGVADHVGTAESAMPGIAWLVRSTARARERPLQAVGVGVSQVLPILVAGLLAPEGTILIMEQPELHLHERPQARLGDFFYGLTRVGKQVFVETHSAVLISQLRYLMVKRGQEAREAIAVYFVEQDEQGDAHFEPIKVSPGGAIENWPDGFFDESFRQEDRITQEGIRARGKRANA